MVHSAINSLKPQYQKLLQKFQECKTQICPGILTFINRIGLENGSLWKTIETSLNNLEIKQNIENKLSFLVQETNQLANEAYSCLSPLQTISTFSLKIQQTQTDLTTLQNRIRELEASASDNQILKNQIDSLNSQLATLLQQLSQLQAEKDRLQQNWNQEKTNLQSQIEQWRNNYNNMANQTNNLSNQLSNLRNMPSRIVYNTQYQNDYSRLCYSCEKNDRDEQRKKYWAWNAGFRNARISDHNSVMYSTNAHYSSYLWKTEITLTSDAERLAYNEGRRAHLNGRRYDNNPYEY